MPGSGKRYRKTTEKERRNSAPTVFLRSLLMEKGRFFWKIPNKPQPPRKGNGWDTVKSYLNLYVVDAMSAMAQGLFASLLIGTIISTLGACPC